MQKWWIQSSLERHIPVSTMVPEISGNAKQLQLIVALCELHAGDILLLFQVLSELVHSGHGVAVGVRYLFEVLKVIPEIEGLIRFWLELDQGIIFNMFCTSLMACSPALGTYNTVVSCVYAAVKLLLECLYYL